MLAIRMQRQGRKGHAQFRVIVQEARLTPTSERVVARLGSYNPHTKEVIIEKDKAAFYLEHGAQPSDRVARLLKKEGVKLPKWVKLEETKERKTRKPEKLRKNRPAEPETAAAPAEDAPAEATAPDTATDEQASETAEAPESAVPEQDAEKAETADQA
jgi:small subunit ribosomal protein S16